MNRVMLFFLFGFTNLCFAQGSSENLEQKGEGSSPQNEVGAAATSEMTTEQQDEFRDVAEMLRCPTCQGLSVLESDAAFSLQMQARVKEQIAAGKSRDEILAYFTSRYGAWILREPPRKGFNLFAWLFPVGLMILGPLAIWFFVWRRRRESTTVGVRSRESIVEEFERLLSQQRVTSDGDSL